MPSSLEEDGKRNPIQREGSCLRGHRMWRVFYWRKKGYTKNIRDDTVRGRMSFCLIRVESSNIGS